MTGPSSQTIGTTEVWTLVASINDLYSEVTVEVLAPFNQTDVMYVDRVSIESVGKYSVVVSLMAAAQERKRKCFCNSLQSLPLGENYHHIYTGDSIANTTREVFDDHGSYVKFDMGYIVNTGNGHVT